MNGGAWRAWDKPRKPAAVISCAPHLKAHAEAEVEYWCYCLTTLVLHDCSFLTAKHRFILADQEVSGYREPTAISSCSFSELPECIHINKICNGPGTCARPYSLVCPFLLSSPAAGQTSFRRFERDLDALRDRFGKPRMSAAIAERRKIIWTRGFGIANDPREQLQRAGRIPLWTAFAVFSAFFLISPLGSAPGATHGGPRHSLPPRIARQFVVERTTAWSVALTPCLLA